MKIYQVIGCAGSPTEQWVVATYTNETKAQDLHSRLTKLAEDNCPRFDWDGQDYLNLLESFSSKMRELDPGCPEWPYHLNYTLQEYEVCDVPE